jgi:hypothetical protein
MRFSDFGCAESDLFWPRCTGAVSALRHNSDCARLFKVQSLTQNHQVECEFRRVDLEFSWSSPLARPISDGSQQNRTLASDMASSQLRVGVPHQILRAQGLDSEAHLLCLQRHRKGRVFIP